jgi:hypothetical protein
VIAEMHSPILGRHVAAELESPEVPTQRQKW